MDAAKSIFEFLTRKNPEIDYPTTSSNSQTSSRRWVAPKQILPWEEFSLGTLKTIYEGTLFQETCRKDRVLLYPPILKEDCVISDEPSTIHIMTKWNHTIVATALNAVKKEFNPCIWVPRNKKRPHRAGRQASYKPTPDAGAVKTHEASDILGSSASIEMLPKGYKTASKWKSEVVLSKNRLLDENGRWIEGKVRKNEAMPIRQVYTYCVSFMCRYGCILTSGEVFVFRIKPLPQKRGSRKESLGRALRNNGLMEYVSIPWTNDSNGDPSDCKVLTMNLALWFIHVLAGNGHEVDWNYDPLGLEKLTSHPSSPPGTVEVANVELGQSETDESDTPFPWKSGSLSRKRRRGSKGDPIHLSFSQKPQFDSQPTEDLTDQSSGSDAEIVQEELEEAARERRMGENNSRRRSLRRRKPPKRRYKSKSDV